MLSSVGSANEINYFHFFGSALHLQGGDPGLHTICAVSAISFTLLFLCLTDERH